MGCSSGAGCRGTSAVYNCVSSETAQASAPWAPATGVLVPLRSSKKNIKLPLCRQKMQALLADDKSCGSDSTDVPLETIHEDSTELDEDATAEIRA